jgi:hypothetical protein
MIRRSSLARPKDKDCGRDEARATVAQIHGWLTEGFDTGALKKRHTPFLASHLHRTVFVQSSVRWRS